MKVLRHSRDGLVAKDDSGDYYDSSNKLQTCRQRQMWRNQWGHKKCWSSCVHIEVKQRYHNLYQELIKPCLVNWSALAVAHLTQAPQSPTRRKLGILSTIVILCVAHYIYIQDFIRKRFGLYIAFGNTEHHEHTYETTKFYIWYPFRSESVSMMVGRSKDYTIHAIDALKGHYLLKLFTNGSCVYVYITCSDPPSSIQIQSLNGYHM